jgi:hypothetical protein
VYNSKRVCALYKDYIFRLYPTIYTFQWLAKVALLSFERAPRPIRQLETIVAGLGIWALGTFTNNLFCRYIFMLQHFLVWYHWMKIVWTKFGIRLFIMICLFQILLSYMTCQFVDISGTCKQHKWMLSKLPRYTI